MEALTPQPIAAFGDSGSTEPRAKWPQNPAAARAGSSEAQSAARLQRSYGTQTPVNLRGRSIGFRVRLLARVACDVLSAPIDSEFDRHANAGLKTSHAIFSQKSIFSAMGCRELKNSYVKLLYRYSRVADRKYVHY